MMLSTLFFNFKYDSGFIAKFSVIWAFIFLGEKIICSYSFRNDNSKIMLGINRIPIYKNNRINSSAADFVNDVNKLPGLREKLLLEGIGGLLVAQLQILFTVLTLGLGNKVMKIFKNILNTAGIAANPIAVATAFWNYSNAVDAVRKDYVRACNES